MVTPPHIHFLSGSKLQQQKQIRLLDADFRLGSSLTLNRHRIFPHKIYLPAKGTAFYRRCSPKYAERGRTL